MMALSVRTTLMHTLADLGQRPLCGPSVYLAAYALRRQLLVTALLVSVS